MIACDNGHKDVVQVLLDHFDTNIDLNARSDGRWTAFMFACRSGHKDIVQLLLDNSDRGVDLLDLNAKSDGGWTAFMFACNNGRKGVVQLLLSKVRNNVIPLGFACKKYCQMDCNDVRLYL